MEYLNEYEVKAEVPTDRGYRFTQINGKGKKIWIDKKKHPLNIVIGNSYLIKTNRDLDSGKNENSQYIKLEKFAISESGSENSKNNTENYLNKCSKCKESFTKEQEYWELKKEGKVVMNSCVECWEADKYTSSKKRWGN